VATRFTELQAALADLADALHERIPQLVEDGLVQMRDELPEFFVRDDDPDFVETYRRSYQQQLRFMFDGLGGERALDRAEPPALAIEEARMSAARGIPLASVVHGYRVTHRLLFEEALSLAVARVGDEALRTAALREASRWLFAYIDWITPRVAAAYEGERERLVRDREQRRRQLVDHVLEGRPVDAAPLAYDLAGEHLGVVAWGAQVNRALAAVRDATGLSLLSVAGTETTVWAWIGGRSIDEQAAVGAALPAGARLAFGAPAHGPDGFRRTHREAWSAYRVARSTDASITRYADVALLALTLQDPATARVFVLRELGPLARDDERTAVLRETLGAYFAAGQNAAVAAVSLGVHDRTVLYRLRTIEERLGRPVRERREELGVALRLFPVVLSGDVTKR
jgi:hypothetical protein